MIRGTTAITPHRVGIAIAVLFSVAIGFHAVSHSHFRIDDYAHFSQSAETSLLVYSLTPIDVHFAPLHRLTTALLYAIGSNHFSFLFPIAVSLLIAVQIAALLLVDRLLDRLRPSPWNGLLLIVFAAHVFLIVPVSWWTSGLHRIPFTALSALSMYAYVRYRDEGRLRDAGMTLGACLLAMGFYSKAALLPPMLLALEICLHRRPFAASVAHRFAIFAGLAGLLSLYPLSYLSHPRGFEPLVPTFNELPNTLLHSLSVFAQAPFGLVATLESSLPIAIALVWGGLVVFTVYRDRWNAIVWLALAGVIAANIVMIGLSQRAEDLGAMVGYLYRYQFELALPLVVFGKLVWNNAASLNDLAGGARWRISPWWVPAVMAVYASFSWMQASDLMRDRYAANQKAHDYTTQILEQLPTVSPLMVMDGKVPRFMWVYDRELRFVSNFLPLLGVHAIYDVPSAEMVRIDIDGAVRRVRPRAGGSVEVGDLGSARPSIRSKRMAVDEAGCVTIHHPDGGVLELAFPESVSLGRAFVSIDYRTESPMTLKVVFRNGSRDRSAGGRGRELALPAGQGARLVDVSVSGPDPIHVRELELAIPESGLCLRAVRLVAYDLDPL